MLCTSLKPREEKKLFRDPSSIVCLSLAKVSVLLLLLLLLLFGGYKKYGLLKISHRERLHLQSTFEGTLRFQQRANENLKVFFIIVKAFLVFWSARLKYSTRNCLFLEDFVLFFIIFGLLSMLWFCMSQYLSKLYYPSKDIMENIEIFINRC